jgi:hypothetical protein
VSLQRTTVAWPLQGNAVQVTIGPETGQRGPWSFVTDAPNGAADMVGPPPLYLGLAAWAA